MTDDEAKRLKDAIDLVGLLQKELKDLRRSYADRVDALEAALRERNALLTTVEILAGRLVELRKAAQ